MVVGATILVGGLFWWLRSSFALRTSLRPPSFDLSQPNLYAYRRGVAKREAKQLRNPPCGSLIASGISEVRTCSPSVSASRLRSGKEADFLFVPVGDCLTFTCRLGGIMVRHSSIYDLRKTHFTSDSWYFHERNSPSSLENLAGRGCGNIIRMVPMRVPRS